MPKSPIISDAEWKVMKLLWKKSPQPAYDIAQTLCRREEWQPRTVKTLLARLVKKGALAFEPYKNLYLYRPLVSEERCVKAESESFLRDVFDGSLSMLLVHFAKRKRLTKDEIRELKRIVAEMEE